jgi:tRNA dimethylallyltransferase
VLVGPTASGKTDLSLRIAVDEFEIVSADSVLVYRYLDIGSGKPTVEERASVAHHLIDIVDPDYHFTAGDFCREARDVAAGIAARGKIPLFVGGTGMYIDALFEGLSDIPRIDPRVKAGLARELEIRGLQALYEELRESDPAFSSRVHMNDRQRILRGLEVFRGTGKPLSAYFGKARGIDSDTTLYIGLAPERDILNRRIDARVDGMMERGFLEEVRFLRERGYGPGLNSMKSIGYAELHAHLDGRAGLAESVERIKLETRRFAKRQMTWFRRNPKVQWFAHINLANINNLIHIWLEAHT